MKFTPILFSTPMVQARQAGRKTKTRRVVKGLALDWLERDGFTPEFVADPANKLSPYGYPGDVLWVRETWMFSDDLQNPYWYKAAVEEEYDAEYLKRLKGLWRPSIFMPKEACRFFLQIQSLKIEHLQSITEEDAVAEGICEAQEFESGRGLSGRKLYENYLLQGYTELLPIDSFQSLWQSINGEESWNANPWVWVIEFQQIEKPESFIRS